MRRRPQVFGLEQHATRFGDVALVEFREIATDHQLDHGVVADLLPGQFAGVFAIAQNGDPVCKLHHLTQPVGNVNDADPLRAQIVNDLEKPLALSLREAGSRLVHDDDPRVDRQCLGDLHQLLMADREVPHEGVGGEIQPNALEVAGGLGVDLSAIDEAGRVRLDAEKNICCDVEVAGEVQLLVNQRDAVGLRVPHGLNPHFRAIDPDSSRVRCVHPGEDFHQRAFAGPVFADHRQHLAPVQGEIDVVKCADAGKLFLKGRDLEERCLGVPHYFWAPSSAILFFSAQNSSMFSLVTIL